MTRAKYKLGKRLTSIEEFDNSDRAFFIIRFRDALGTRSRTIVEGWQYKTVKAYIEKGHLFEADKVVQE